MTPVATVPATMPVAEVFNLLRMEESPALPIGEEQDVIGIATSADLLQCTAENGCNPEAMPVEEIAVPVIPMCSDEDEVDEVIDRMKKQNQENLLVRDSQGKFIGAVSLKSLVEAGQTPKRAA